MNAALARKPRAGTRLALASSLILVLALAFVSGPIVALSHVAHAEPAVLDAQAEIGRRAKIAVRVGSRTMTVGELEDRLLGIPPFQLATFGASREAVVQAFVDQVIVRDMVLAAGAELRGLDKELPTTHQLARARSNATLRSVRAGTPGIANAASIPSEDVQRYYDANKSRFDSPERINLWRILCKTREEAASVLEAAKREPTIAKYNDLAREHSIDKATNLRGGNLGFVAADGTSNEAGLRVEPALVQGAAAVKDGEFVPQPVVEGAAFAVIWRRGTVPATRRTLADAAPQIRSTLFRERSEAAEKKLIDELRAKNVKNVDEGLLGLIEMRPFDAGVMSPRSVPPLPDRDAARPSALPR